MSQLTITSIDRGNFFDPTFQSIRSGYDEDQIISTTEVFRSDDNVPQEYIKAKLPAAFLLMYEYVPLFVTGKFRFPTGTASYELRVYGPGGFEMISNKFAMVGSVNETKEFTTGSFTIESPKAETPFRVAGDWVWTLYDARGRLLATSAPTRLEIYFFLGSTRLPVPGDHHLLDLIRLTIPQYQLVAGLSWLEAEAALLKNMMANLWTLGGQMLRYDSDHTNGGRTWLVDRDIFKLQRMLYPTGEIRWCNCFDLATLVQVATDSVGGKPDPDNPNREFWVIQNVTIHEEKPWGYIRAGPLFGWDSTPERKCNSPFWYPDKQHFFRNLKDPERSYFAMHTFAHFTRVDGVVAVLDLTHGILDDDDKVILEAGQHDVTTYRRRTIDQGCYEMPAYREIEHCPLALRVQQQD